MTPVPIFTYVPYMDLYYQYDYLRNDEIRQL